MIPDGWTETTLAEIADVIDCKHRTPSYADAGIPLISPGNISWGKLDLDNCKHVIHDDYVDLMDHCKVNLGDLVMGRNQSFGVASYVHDDRIFALGQDTILIKPKDCNSKFLYQIIQSPLFQEQINRLSSGSTFKRINLKDIRNLRVLAPSSDCQIKIAEVLGFWDESIDLLEKLIGKTRSRKQGLIQQLLTGKKRFKEFEGSEWKKVSIGEIAFVDKRSLNSSTLKNYTFLYISLSNIDNGRISNNLEQLCFEKAPSRARRLVSNNDILMATVRPNLKSFAMVKTDADKYVVSTGFAVISAKKDYSTFLIYEVQLIFAESVFQ